MEVEDDFLSTYQDEDPFFEPKAERPNRTPEEYKRKLAMKPRPRSKDEWDAIFQFYPTEVDGYVKSFEAEDFEIWHPVMQKYGFVVLNNIFTEAQCDATVAEFFDDLNRRATQEMKVDPDEPMSWERTNFPSGHKKFLVGVPALTQHAFENRTNPKAYEVFVNLLDREDLFCSIDNWGLFRGTKNLRWKDENGKERLIDRDDWRYNLRLHWDYNPWVLQKWLDLGEPVLYQGILAIGDCPTEVGGFAAVPCSHTFMGEWISERPCPRMSRGILHLPEDDPMQRYIQKVPLRKGEFVIWYSHTAHCNFANYSPKMRLHQFIRCLPATKHSQDKDRYSARRIAHAYRDDPFTDWSLPYLTPLGRKLVGLDEWEKEKKCGDRGTRSKPDRSNYVEQKCEEEQ